MSFKHLFILSIFGAITILALALSQKPNLNQSPISKCYEERNDIIRGASLEPFLKDGAQVKTLIGYYDCNPFMRGEVVIFKFQTREETFVKKLLGLGRDKLEIKEDKIYLNGDVLANSQNEPYLVDERAKLLLTKPLTDAKIPENSFLALSDKPYPTFDSRSFGFLTKEHILGKVEF